MEFPQTDAPLAQALVITRTMLDAAQRQDWQQVADMEAVRAPLLHRQHPQDAGSHAQLGELLAYDRELQALVGQARDEAAGRWQREHGRAQAIAAYAQS